MSLPRFFIPPESWNPDALVLDGDEAHHCSAVMRRGAGEHIIVFNGAGSHAEASIVSGTAKRVELTCVNLQQEPPPTVSITLLQAIPKGSNMELIIEKAVELGVNGIVPVMSERTVVRLDAKEAAKKQEKWQRIALAACKQCGQNWLPRIHVPQSFSTVWSALPSHDLRLVAALQNDARTLKTILAEIPKSVLILIGPEGDLTAEEYSTAREHGCVPMTLGPVVLRVETAAMYCLSVLGHELRLESSL
jgi:16S rRNA (uracil1498-N3)-methyltransferase